MGGEVLFSFLYLTFIFTTIQQTDFSSDSRDVVRFFFLLKKRETKEKNYIIHVYINGKSTPVGGKLSAERQVDMRHEVLV